MDLYFRNSGRSNLQFFYLAHILCSCTHQYECDDVLDGFWGPGDGCLSDTGSKTVPGQIIASINLRGLRFIHEYSLYITKISTYTVYWETHSVCKARIHGICIWYFDLSMYGIQYIGEKGKYTELL